MDAQAIWLTLRLAATTTFILLAVGLPLSLWLAQRASTSRALVQAAIALPLVLPPTVIGFYLLIGLGPATAPGRALIHLLGHPLAFSFAGLVVGSAIYSLPFAVMPLVAGFQSIGPEFAEAAALLGASPLRAFLTVTLPLARPAVLTSAVLVFIHTIGEFGVVLMVGGNIPGTTRTLSISIFDLVEDGRYPEAAHLSLVLIAVAIIGLALVYARPRRQLA